MAKFTTVLWDIGGVLLTNGWDHLERKAVFDQFGVPDAVRAEFEQRHERENDPWEKGEIDFEQYLDRTLFFEPRPYTPAAIRQAIEEQSKLIPNTAMPILKELRARGQVRMGQLNNESRELNDLRLDRFGLNRLLSLFLCSSYVRLRKPDPAIYRLAQEVLQTPASEIMFIDDREKNANEARDFGFHAIEYKGPEALRAELTTLGLL